MRVTTSFLRRRLGARSILLALALCATALGIHLATEPASAATYYVSPAGSDQNPGSQELPYRSIQQAATVARDGDAVLVASGNYPETVWLDGRASGVTFRGIGDTRPVIDGEGSRKYGISTSRELTGATIDNFEITGQTDEGVRLLGSSNVLANSVIHHVGAQGEPNARGVLAWGDRLRIAGNTIYSVGPGEEAMGIMLATSRDSQVDSNTIYLIRKEGVRDYKGLDNSITNNRIFLTWTAIAPNYSTGGYVANNELHDNTQGFNPKHTSDPSTLAYWGIDSPRWTKFWHNTVTRSSASSVALAINLPTADFIDIRDNVFGDAGGAQVADAPEARGTNVILDGNAYSSAGPRWLYHSGYDYGANGQSDLGGMRAALGWEQSGQRLDGTPGDSLELPDALGRQLGARGLAPASVTWTPYAMKPIASSSAGAWYTKNHLADSSDGAQQTYWLTDSPSDEWVTYDFGRARSFDHLVLDVYADGDKRMARKYRFEVSDDNVHFREILSGTNADSRGSSYKYELPNEVTARYVRFTMVDTFCDQYSPRAGCGDSFVLSDVRAGKLARAGEQPRVDPSTNAVLSKRPVELTPSGKVRVALACPADRVEGCRGAIDLIIAAKRAAGGHKGWLAGRRLGDRAYRIGRGRRQYVTITLSKPGLKALRRQRSSARVWATVSGGTAAEWRGLRAIRILRARR
ncbi:MAG: hypothetical protein QOJ12_258 [Thermoleophilales bacterium]|nr:hypothetical protein [Thermoleophilales bacterium]